MAHASPYKTITDPELIRKKNELRKAVSEEYIKNCSNPYRNIKMEGGTLVRMLWKSIRLFVVRVLMHTRPLQFDVGVQRYMSMKATQHEFFRPTTKNSLLGVLLFVIPYFSLTYVIKRERVRIFFFLISYPQTWPCAPIDLSRCVTDTSSDLPRGGFWRGLSKCV